MRRYWIIEKRNADGSLDFSTPQPERFYGTRAITGIDEDTLAAETFRNAAPNTDPVLLGTNIPHWPSFVHPKFIARRKTW